MEKDKFDNLRSANEKAQQIPLFIRHLFWQMLLMLAIKLADVKISCHLVLF